MATPEIYTLSLHDALPIYLRSSARHRWRPAKTFSVIRTRAICCATAACVLIATGCRGLDRKSTRLNSSHANSSYAVFCFKKKNSADVEIDLDELPAVEVLA